MKPASLPIILLLTVVFCHVIPIDEARPIPAVLDSCLADDGLCPELAKTAIKVLDRISARANKIWANMQSLSYQACTKLHVLHIRMEDSVLYLRQTGEMWYDRFLAYLEEGKGRLRGSIHAVSTAVKTFDYEGKAKMLHAGLTGILGKFVTVCP
ncbi:hypothetical protein ElyMa_002871300 [Elysia marginata]|uniref:Uncharacterized protein n=1 Tax=Elysia marginata TaxID=1093978 RepID=A0AAV4HXJ8_9GAST|nr:hypothetical protein ElyMa_002871300 [Elysia marginata]